MGLMSFLFIGVNVIFWAFGGTLLGLGIWMAVDPNAFDGLDASGMNDAMWAAMVYTMIGVGAFVFLVGFLGCCGAKRKDHGKIMLKLYNVFVGITILAEIVIIILTAIFWSSINDSLAQQMQKDVKTQYEGTDPGVNGISVSWNKMQYEWKCCGSYDFTDYSGSNFATVAQPVPYTCCVYKDGASQDDYLNGLVNSTGCLNEARGYVLNKNFQYLNARGCYGELSNFFERNAAIIIGVTCGVLGLQILGIIFACCLMKD